MTNLNIHQEQFSLRSSDARPDGKIRLQSICDLLQEAAGNHAHKLNFDIADLQKNNLTWVLYRLHIRMERYPEWPGTVVIKTWPSSGDRLRAYRDFQLFDEKGNEIGRALSYWLMLNVKSRRPVPMPQSIRNMAPDDITHLVEVQNQRLSGLELAETSKTFDVRRSDLDLNRHVNNVKYIEWIMETLPQDRAIRELDIEFHGECNLGDTVVSALSGRENVEGFRHQISRRRDNKVVARALSLF